MPEACARRYGTYKLVQRMPGGEGLVGFTRILHRTKPDLLMDEARPRQAPPAVTNQTCQVLRSVRLCKSARSQGLPLLECGCSSSHKANGMSSRSLGLPVAPGHAEACCASGPCKAFW